jgi:hypothetical protein
MIGSSKIGLRPIRGGGGGAAPNLDFVSTWDTTGGSGSASNTIVLPLLVAGTYSGTIDWGDGSTSVLSYANRTHVYAITGIKTITITGICNGFAFGGAGDRRKILTVSQWGNGVTLGSQALRDTRSLQITATDAPNIGTTNMTSFFNYCANTYSVNHWNTTGVTSLLSCFINSSYNQSLNSWDVSQVTTCNEMFRTSAMTADISAWNIANVFDFRTFQTGAFTTPNYDAILVAWQPQITTLFASRIDFGTSKYTIGSAAEAARTALVLSGITVNDGGGI